MFSNQYNLQPNLSGDPIQSLPVDDINPSANDMELSKILFGQEEDGNDRKKIPESQSTIINLGLIGLLYIIMSLEQTDRFLTEVLPSVKSQPYLLLFVKCLLVVLIYYVMVKFNIIGRLLQKN